MRVRNVGYTLCDDLTIALGWLRSGLASVKP